MTTIDLLLTLGGKIAEILMLTMKKKATKQDKEEAQNLIEQYNQLRETHRQIEEIVKQYNSGIIQAITLRTLPPFSLYVHTKDMSTFRNFTHTTCNKGYETLSLKS